MVRALGNSPPNWERVPQIVTLQASGGHRPTARAVPGSMEVR